MRLEGIAGLLGAMLLMAAASPAVMHAQQQKQALAADAEVKAGLPDAPGVQEESQKPSGSICGTVLDTNGDVIQNARVVLTSKNGPEVHILQSGGNGEFNFSGLPAGTFKVTVTGPGMGTFVSPEIPLHAGEIRLVPGVVLAIAADTTSIRVEGDRNELAEEQMHIAIDQRIFGVMPNFYSSYDWNAPPMGAKQKFHLALKAATDPVAFLGYGFVSGMEQAQNSFPGYGQGAAGYGKRYGAVFANDAIGRLMGSAVFPSLLRQDPRYFYKGTGSVRSRVLYAISRAVICRGDNGHSQPNFSHVFGSLAAGGLSNLYFPQAEWGASLTFVNTLVGTAGNAANNLVREFVMKGISTRARQRADGTP